jgi:hypothetical protein
MPDSEPYGAVREYFFIDQYYKYKNLQGISCIVHQIYARVSKYNWMENPILLLVLIFLNQAKARHCTGRKCGT